MADIVEVCTDTFEDPKPEWQERKQRYVDRLKDELGRMVGEMEEAVGEG